MYRLGNGDECIV